MFIPDSIRARTVLHESRFILLASGLYSMTVVMIREFTNFHFFSTPTAPVTMIGVAVSLYLGFKSNQAYGRWWEARTTWGAIINDSRSWANAVLNLAQSEDGKPIDHQTRRALVLRHLAWLNALAFQLRVPGRIRPESPTRMFDHIAGLKGPMFHRDPECYQRLLNDSEREDLAGKTNHATHIMIQQGAALGELASDKRIDSYRHEPDH